MKNFLATGSHPSHPISDCSDYRKRFLFLASEPTILLATTAKNKVLISCFPNLEKNPNRAIFHTASVPSHPNENELKMLDSSRKLYGHMLRDTTSDKKNSQGKFYRKKNSPTPN